MEELQCKHDACLSLAASQTLEKAELQNNFTLKCRIEKAIRRIEQQVRVQDAQALRAVCLMRVFLSIHVCGRPATCNLA